MYDFCAFPVNKNARGFEASFVPVWASRLAQEMAFQPKTRLGPYEIVAAIGL